MGTTRTIVSAWVTALALGLTYLGSAEPRHRTPQLAADARLARPITLYRSTILLGDLLEQIERETGVSISLAASDPTIGSIELAAGLPGVPAWTVLEGVRSLERTPGAIWFWKGAGTGGDPYVLGCSRSLLELAAERSARVEAVFHEDAALTLEGASLSGERLEAFLRRHPDQRRILQHPGNLAGIRALADLPPPDREDIFAGKRRTWRFAEAPPGFQAVARQRYAKLAEINPGHPEFREAPPADALIIVTRDRPSREIVPMVFIEAGVTGGGSYLGGESANGLLKQEDEEFWHLDATPGADLEGSEFKPMPKVAQRIPEEAWKRLSERGESPEPPQPIALTPPRHIKWLATARKLPILADLGWRRGPRISMQEKGRAAFGQVMESLSSASPLMHKRFHGLMLVRDRGWHLNPAGGRISYPDIVNTRSQLSTPHPSALAIWAALGPYHALERDQLQPLLRCFPVVALIPRIRPALVIHHTGSEDIRARLLAAQGVRMADLHLRSKQGLTRLMGGRWRGGEIAGMRAARMRVITETPEGEVRLGYEVSAGDRTQQSAGTLRAASPHDSLFLMPEERDEFELYPKAAPAPAATLE